jgi:hypothetical protein
MFPPGPGKARDESAADWIANPDHDNRNAGSRLLGSLNGRPNRPATMTSTFICHLVLPLGREGARTVPLPSGPR